MVNYKYEDIITKEQLVQRKRAIILHSKIKCEALLIISKIINDEGSINAYILADRLGIALEYARRLLNEFVQFHKILAMDNGISLSRIKSYVINDKIYIDNLIDDIAKIHPEIIAKIHPKMITNSEVTVEHKTKMDEVSHTKRVVKK
jgi:hypothetical protein